MQHTIHRFKILAFTLFLNFTFHSVGKDLASEDKNNEKLVTITIVTDRDTWIAGRGPTSMKPEKYRKRTFRLLPGKYKISSARFGYAPFGVILDVEKGKIYNPIVVRCIEKDRGKKMKEIDWEVAPRITGRIATEE